MKAICHILILLLIQLASSTKRAECFIIASKNSGINGYIRFYQDNITSKVEFQTILYGTDEIESFNIHKNANFRNDCNNLGPIVYKPLISNPIDKHNLNEIIILHGEIPNFTLYEEDGFTPLSCSVEYKSSRKNKIHNNYDHESIKLGGCGNLQHYDPNLSIIIGMLIILVNIILVSAYFKRNKI